ncbi:hypothetical protein J0656_06015 [Muricauda ruestringensis]|uniref:Nitrogen regulatory IIA protein n=1 Tax=Flagellimonas aurea TaxID=2915619 RepID=A0ABS3G2D0_9FLAO|nr:hypothetical protein [Allomuricauda aurea]MBO0353568.1 hypothetical protein [Allomuricauda aurea]
MNKKTQNPDQAKAKQSATQLLSDIQKKWASWMERKTSNFSHGTWYILLFILITVSIGFNSWLIYDSLMEREEQEIFLSNTKENENPTFDQTRLNDTLSNNRPADPLVIDQK